MPEAPIFIGGLSYSGKTQLREMLDEHPHLSLLRRTGMWRFYGQFGDLDVEDNRRRAEAVLKSSYSGSAPEFDWDKAFEELTAGPTTYPRLFGIAQTHHAATSGRSRWGEQYGRIVELTGDIIDTFPEARFVHMMRYPRGRIARMIGTRRRPGWVGWETGASIESRSLAHANVRQYPENYLVVHYEDLRSTPLECVERVCKFIGEAPDPIVDSDVLSRVRFDEAPKYVAAGVGQFPDDALPDWSSPSNGSEPLAWRSLLARHPINASALWYRLNASRERLVV